MALTYIYINKLVGLLTSSYRLEKFSLIFLTNCNNRFIRAEIDNCHVQLFFFTLKNNNFDIWNDETSS